MYKSPLQHPLQVIMQVNNKAACDVLIKLLYKIARYLCIYVCNLNFYLKKHFFSTKY